MTSRWTIVLYMDGEEAWALCKPDFAGPLEPPRNIDAAGAALFAKVFDDMAKRLGGAPQ